MRHAGGAQGEGKAKAKVASMRMLLITVPCDTRR